MTSKEQVKREIEMLQRVLRVDVVDYEKSSEETNQLITRLVESAEQAARHLTSRDVERLREELKRKEEMVSSSTDYTLACECAAIRNILSRYADLQNSGANRT